MEKYDFTKMSNAEINLAKMTLEKEYEAKKAEILKSIKELENLDNVYISAEEELKKRGVLTNDEYGLN